MFCIYKYLFLYLSNFQTDYLIHNHKLSMLLILYRIRLNIEDLARYVPRQDSWSPTLRSSIVMIYMSTSLVTQYSTFCYLCTDFICANFIFSGVFNVTTLCNFICFYIPVLLNINQSKLHLMWITAIPMCLYCLLWIGPVHFVMQHTISCNIRTYFLL